MRILDVDPKGTNGGTLYEFENGVTARLVDILKGNYDPSIKLYAEMIINNVLTQDEAESKWWRSRK